MKPATVVLLTLASVAAFILVSYYALSAVAGAERRRRELYEDRLREMYGYDIIID